MRGGVRVIIEQLLDQTLVAFFASRETPDDVAQRALRWAEIERSSDGGWWMRICTEKTETEARLPISDEALELCGEVQNEGVVFAGLRRCMIQHPLHAWIKAAGIRKHITFHRLRHCISSFPLKTNDLQKLDLRQVTI